MPLENSQKVKDNKNNVARRSAIIVENVFVMHKKRARNFMWSLLNVAFLNQVKYVIYMYLEIMTKDARYFGPIALKADDFAVGLQLWPI